MNHSQGQPDSHIPELQRKLLWSGAQLFLLLGSCVMLSELLWVRSLSLVLGSDLLGISISVSAFLLGAAAGAACAARLSWPAHRWLAMAVILVFSISYYLEFFLPSWSLNSEILTHLWARCLCAAPISLFSFCMAAVLPASFRLGQSHKENSTAQVTAPAEAKKMGSWIAALDIGSAIGALALPFWLLPHFGSWSCFYLLWAGVLLCFFISWRNTRQFSSPAKAPPTQEKASPLSLDKFHLAIAFACGFCAFALQVLWVRLLGEVLGTSLMVLGLSTAVLLLGGAIAAFLIPKLLQKFGALRLMTSALFAWAFAQAVSAIWIAYLPVAYVELASNLDPHASVGGIKLLAVFIALFPSALASGFVLPTLAVGFGGNSQEVARKLGAVESATLLGGSVGCALIGLFLIPVFGSATSLLTVFALTFLVSCWSFRALLKDGLLSEYKTFKRIVYGLGFASLLFSSVAIWSWDEALLGAGVFQWSRQDISSGLALDGWRKREILFQREGQLARVMIEKSQEMNTVFFRVGGRVEGTVPIDWSKPHIADLPTQCLLGILPALYLGEESKVFVIGVGGGTTVSSVVECNGKGVTAVEVEPAVYEALKSEAGRKALPWEHRHLFEGENPPRLRVGDARAILHREDQLYDAIVCQPSEPWLPWSAPLFSQDFYKLMASRISDKGVAIQWIQLYRIPEEHFLAILSAFRSSFDNVHLYHPPGTSEVIVVGSKGEAQKPWLGSNWSLPGVMQLRKRLYWDKVRAPRPLLDSAKIDSWLASSAQELRSDLRSQLEARLVIAGESGEDYARPLLKKIYAFSEEP